MRAGFWWGDVGKREHLEELGADMRITLKQFFNK
jgi:hypothetical protein